MAEVLLAVHWPFAFPDFNGASRLTRVPNTTSGPTLWLSLIHIFVGLEDLVDHAQEVAESGLRACDALAIAGRLGVGQDFFEDLGADPVIPPDRALRDTFDQHLAPDLRPHLHVGVHPSPVSTPSSRREA